MRIKKLVVVALSTMMVASLVACGKTDAGSTEVSGAADKKVTLVMAEVNPLDTIVGKIDTAFKQKVEELSGGSITIDLQASGVLGAENDVLDTMLGGGGTIDISRISAFALTSYGCKKSSLLSIPYTFDNRAHYWNFVNSSLAQEFLMEPHDLGLGVRGLFYGEEGFRSFFANKPLNSITDLKGMKLRVSSDPIMTGMVNGLGASPTVVAFTELYSALQTGVVDGAEQPIANYKSGAYPEVANYLILDGHTLGAVEVVITDSAWDKLSANQQKAITDASKYAGDYDKQISADAENAALDALKKAGCKVVDVTDKTPWKKACATIIASASKDNTALYQKLLDLK